MLCMYCTYRYISLKRKRKRNQINMNNKKIILCLLCQISKEKELPDAMFSSQELPDGMLSSQELPIWHTPSCNKKIISS